VSLVFLYPVRPDLPRTGPAAQAAFLSIFFAGVAGKPGLNQTDGIHPTSAGVEVIVKLILPLVEETLDKINQQGKIKG